MIFDEIWRMQRRRSKMLKNYRKQVAILRKDHDEQEVDAVLHDTDADLAGLEGRLMIAESDALVQTALQLKVPLPELFDKKSWQEFFGPRVLTSEAYAALRSAIRQEKKERRDAVISLIKDIISPIGGIIISVLSLLIAYAALKLKH